MAGTYMFLSNPDPSAGHAYRQPSGDGVAKFAPGKVCVGRTEQNRGLRALAATWVRQVARCATKMNTSKNAYFCRFRRIFLARIRGSADCAIPRIPALLADRIIAHSSDLSRDQFDVSPDKHVFSSKPQDFPLSLSVSLYIYQVFQKNTYGAEKKKKHTILSRVVV